MTDSLRRRTALQATAGAALLSCLPAAMQRVYSIRFLRNKGKLQVKR